MAGIETPIGTGTAREAIEAADRLVRKLVKEQHFTWTSEDSPFFEPLPHIRALAKKLGFEVVYDAEPGKLGHTSAGTLNNFVLLDDWRGLKAKKKGRFLYALLRDTIIANPTLPENEAKATVDLNNIEAVEQLMARIKAIGKTRVLALGYRAGVHETTGASEAANVLTSIGN
jgi:hypothetical protein